MPPGPIPMHFAIIAVPFTFWACIMMGGWPGHGRSCGTRSRRAWRCCAAAHGGPTRCSVWHFDYTFLEGAPVYLASAPAGGSAPVPALVFIVTALAGMFLVLHFDLWPLTLAPAVMRQPVLGLVWTAAAVALAWLATAIGLGVLGMDPMVFLTRVTVPFIFGTILVLNMLRTRCSRASRSRSRARPTR